MTIILLKIIVIYQDTNIVGVHLALVLVKILWDPYILLNVACVVVHCASFR